MKNYEDQEKRAAAHEAAATTGQEPRSSRAADLQAGLIRYLAAQAYREKVEETRKAEDDEPGTPR